MMVVFFAVCAPAAADRTITISGDRSGYAVVDFPLPASGPEVAKSMKVTGTGRFFGFLIRPDTSKLDAQPIQGAMRAEAGVFCDVPCDGDRSDDAPLFHVDFFPWDPGTGTGFLDIYPPGRYRVHLIADEEPVSATFTIPSLDTQSIALTPQVPTRAEVRSPDLINLDPAGSGKYGGDNGTLDSFGLLWIVEGFYSATPYAGVRLEDCIYAGPQEPTAYLPTCPGESWLAKGAGMGGPWTGGGGWGAIVGTFDKGEYGLGGNVVVAGAVPEIAIRSAWISFLPAGTPVVDTPSPAPQQPAMQQQQTSAPAASPSSTTGLAIARITRVRSGRVKVTLRCGGRGPCAGTVKAAPGGRAVKVSLRPGIQKTVKLQVPRRACRIEAGSKTRRITRRLPGRRCGS